MAAVTSPNKQKSLKYGQIIGIRNTKTPETAEFMINENNTSSGSGCQQE
jgi:hypothetical protein